MHAASIIDWLSFTIPCEPMEVRSHDEMYKRVGEAQEAFAPQIPWVLIGASDWQKAKGRAPYRECLRSPSLGLSVYWSSQLTHILHEFSGTGCAYLREQGMLVPMLEAFASRITRLDLATDFEDDVSPAEFVSNAASGRIKSRGSFQSTSGETEYVGSAKSEMFARVYRYAAPHPRAGLLRVEHVLRRDYARSIVPYLVEYGLPAAQKTVGDKFGWMHPIWSAVSEQGIEWCAPRNDRKSSGTERWLIVQAAPAFKKLVVSGVIENPHQWLATYFLEGVDGMRQLPLELE